MIPWNPEATAQDHLAAARDSLPCDLCGGPGWIFGGGYGLIGCAECNDDDHKPSPRAIFLPRLSRPPEPWTEVRFSNVWPRQPLPLSHRSYYECAQCGTRAGLHFLAAGAGWWTCLCLAAAETAAGVVVLKFPQPVRMG